MQTPLTAGNPSEPMHHNVNSNVERDGLKSYRIGRSAAKTLRLRVRFNDHAFGQYYQVVGNGENLEILT